MDSGDAARLIILFALLLLSAFFSSAETAFTSLNKLRIKSMAEEGVKKAGLVLSLLDKNTKFLSTILIGNNIVNIAASALTTVFAQKLFGNAAIGIATGILTLLVLIFGEITPKTMASIHAEKMAFIYAPLEVRIDTVMKRFNLNEKQARDQIAKEDKARASYFNYYTSYKWGKNESYDILIDSSLLGPDGTAELLLDVAKKL